MTREKGPCLSSAQVTLMLHWFNIYLLNEWMVNEWNIGLGSAQWGQFHPFEIHYSLCKLAQYFSRFCVLGVPLGCPGSWISFAEILVEHYLRQSAGRSTTRWVVLKLVTTELLMCIGGAASDIKLLALWEILHLQASYFCLLCPFCSVLPHYWKFSPIHSFTNSRKLNKLDSHE